jgi:hypothetical protein
VSLIVIVPLVATTGPDGPANTDAVNVCGPSVVTSAVAVTLNEPTLSVIVNDPLLALKSADAVVI